MSHQDYRERVAGPIVQVGVTSRKGPLRTLRRGDR
jgi:hypothetical protein